MEKDYIIALRECVEDRAKCFEKGLKIDYNAEIIDTKQYNLIMKRVDCVFKGLDSENIYSVDYQGLLNYIEGLQDMYNMIFWSL